MALNTWNIVTARKQFAELETKLAGVEAENASLKSSIGDNNSEAVKAADGLQAELAAAKVVIAQCKADLTTSCASIASQAAEIEGLKAKLASKDEEVKITVARQVANTTAALGVPPAPAIPQTATASTDTSKLFGLAKVIACEKAETEARNAKK